MTRTAHPSSNLSPIWGREDPSRPERSRSSTTSKSMISSISSVNNRLQYSARSAHHHVEVDGVLRAVLIVPMPSTFVRDSTMRHGPQPRTNMGVSGTLSRGRIFGPSVNAVLQHHGLPPRINISSEMWRKPIKWSLRPRRFVLRL